MGDEIERAKRVVGEAHSWEQRCDSDDLMRNTYEPLLEVLRVAEIKAEPGTHLREVTLAALTALREALPEEGGEDE